jgi:hypothetical protein
MRYLLRLPFIICMSQYPSNTILEANEAEEVVYV